MSRRLALLSSVLLAACGPSPSSSDGADAGAPPRDAGTVLDAGDFVDDDPPPDAGDFVDAGPPLDAGDHADAGLPDDAGSPQPLDAGPLIVTLAGHLVAGPGALPGGIAGVRFASGSTHGLTDAQGGFRYESGQAVTFRIGDAVTTVAGSATRTPFALAASRDCAVTSALRRLLVLLESLDDDRDPSNGLRIPESMSTATTTVPLASLDDAGLDAMVRRLANGQAPVNADAALHRFIAQVDGEAWAEVSTQTFDSATSAARSQGIASDGREVWFSWRLGLQRTDLQYNVAVKNNAAIPLQYFVKSFFNPHASDHIGDIDVYGGRLYAPVEDSKDYAAPRILVYGTDQLDYTGEHYDLPANLLTKGVPWVAVDGPRGLAYAAEWDPTPSIFVFQLGNFQLARTLPLSQGLTRIQGAKVWRDMLYAHADDPAKTDFKINLETGTVIPLFATNRGDVENEGIAFFDLPDGSVMHTMNATPDRQKMEIHHHRRTRGPLRDEVCPAD